MNIRGYRRSRPREQGGPLLIALLIAASLETSADAIARNALAEGPAAGLTVAVERGGKIALLKGYGLANVELKSPARPDTVYRIGSMTKQFTAAAILQLVESGGLRLDE